MTLHIKPRNGLQVRTPAGHHLRAEGEQVPHNSYWLRRLKAGDVVLVENPTEQQGAKAK
ncbi:DUF2635 domain-containing protein [Endozoicomonas sp. ALB115]|uniref:DUF2635 domain-containing protein n=1 Tax=Endozoicomonas sp. ALB115 TaxID=3403074 RepID=UPI003BB74486